MQRLFQSGSYQQAVDAARDGDPASTFLGAQALLKLDQGDRAADIIGDQRFAGFADQAPARLIARAQSRHFRGRAVALARQATEADGDNPFAHYQLGLAASKASDWGTATAAFTRALELKPDLAYAHYYAALANQRQRNLPKTAEHFDAFLRLAPDAPERSAVVAILRTIK